MNIRVGCPSPVPVSRDQPLPATLAQEWALQLAGVTKNSIPVALRFTGPLDLTVLRRSLTEIVRRHESLRTSFRWEGGEAHLVISDGWSIQVLQSELTLLYAAFAKGRPSPRMSTIARNFETLLARITADPDIRLSRLREMVQENA
jgi:hypothetical protein